MMTLNLIWIHQYLGFKHTFYWVPSIAWLPCISESAVCVLASCHCWTCAQLSRWFSQMLLNTFTAVSSDTAVTHMLLGLTRESISCCGSWCRMSDIRTNMVTSSNTAGCRSVSKDALIACTKYHTMWLLSKCTVPWCNRQQLCEESIGLNTCHN